MEGVIKGEIKIEIKGKVKIKEIGHKIKIVIERKRKRKRKKKVSLKAYSWVIKRQEKAFHAEEKQSWRIVQTKLKTRHLR